MTNERVFIVQTQNSAVVAVYNDETLAKKMLPLISEKLKSKCFLVSKLVNADLGIIGNDDVNK
jgi:hypothetical protein